MRFILALIAAVVLLVSEANGQNALTPVVTSASATSLIVKVTPGHLWGLSVANMGASSGFAAVLNQATVPTGGSAITPLACVALPANGNAQLFPAMFGLSLNVAIVVVITTGATCFTYTVGAATGFIMAIAD
jgi:hypothetical protein